MPIYGVLERGLRLPRIGVIRKGIKVPVMDRSTGKPKVNTEGQIVTRPKEVEYFVVQTDPRDNETPAILGKAYGEKPTQFNIFLPFPEPAADWDYWLEAYTYSQLVARADGRYIIFLRDVETGDVLVREGALVKEPRKDTFTAKIVGETPIGGRVPYQDEMAIGLTQAGDAITFKAVGRLNVIIPELRRLATFTVMTGSLWYDIPQITAAIELASRVASITNRPMNTIPMVIRRVPRVISVPKDKGANGERVKTTKHFIEMEITPVFATALLEAYEGSPVGLALQTATAPALPAPTAIDMAEEDYEVPVEISENGAPTTEEEDKAVYNVDALQSMAANLHAAMENGSRLGPTEFWAFVKKVPFDDFHADEVRVENTRPNGATDWKAAIQTLLDEFDKTYS